MTNYMTDESDAGGGPFRYKIKINDAHFNEIEREFEGNAYNKMALVLDTEATFSNGKVMDKTVEFGIGKGWTIENSGRNVVRTNGGDEPFHGQCAYKKWIKSSIPLMGTDVDPRQAEIWVGKEFDVVQEEQTLNDGKKVKVLLVDNGEKPAEQQGATISPINGGLADTLKATLLYEASEVKAANGSHEDFVAKVSELPEVSASAEAQDAVLQTGEGSIWMSANTSA